MTTENNINQVHDKLVRSCFADKKVAVGFFKQHLSEKVLQAINFDTIVMLKNTYIDKKFEKLETDLVFQVDFNDHPGYLTILLEHQRNAQKLLPLRILEYMCRIMREHTKNSKDNKLPVVVPLILFNGVKPYQHSSDILDLFNDPYKLMPEVLFKPFKIVDVNIIPEDIMLSESWSGSVEYCLKHSKDIDIVQALNGLEATISDLKQQDGMEHIETLLKYMLSCGEIPDKKAYNVYERVFKPKARGETMNLLQALQNEGEAKGRMSERYELALKLVAQGASIAEAARLVELTVEQREELQAELITEV